MKKLMALLAITALFISCNREVSTTAVDDFVSSIDGKIKNERLRFKKITGFDSFVNELTCYYANGKIVCISASAGSSYDLNTYRFYLNDGHLVLSRIEYAMLKMNYWDTMDKVVFNNKNSRIVKEESYFLTADNKLIRINGGKYGRLSADREKDITNQFNEIFKMAASYQ